MVVIVGGVVGSVVVVVVVVVADIWCLVFDDSKSWLLSTPFGFVLFVLKLI